MRYIVFYQPSPISGELIETLTGIYKIDGRVKRMSSIDIIARDYAKRLHPRATHYVVASGSSILDKLQELTNKIKI